MGETTIAATDLEALIARALIASRTSASNAASVAAALTAAEIDGQKGHGLSRVPSYAAQARSGKVDGHAVPRVHAPRPATIMIDVAGGFAYPALDLAVEKLPSLAAQFGIAAGGLVHSHHCGVVGRHVERLERAGMVALMVANTPQAMAAWGGKRAVFGTNPIGFAVPRRDREPLVIDMALSEVARGKIMTAAQKGDPIPLGWAVDEAGRPTTDAKAALKGTLTPVGGAKGAALALMVEILAAALTGANFAAEASSFFDAEGSSPGVGQTLIAIAPDGMAGREVFLDRFAILAEMVEGDAGARLPGGKRLQGRARAAAEGIRVDDKLLAEVKAMAAA